MPNIIIPPEGGRLSIIDFSPSVRIAQPNRKFRGVIGTEKYIAPASRVLFHAQNTVLNHGGADTTQSQEIEGSAARFENLAQGIGAPCIAMPSTTDVRTSLWL
ncbi:hypothetical protein HYDPIDRAFT_118369 [Hydnomerulius pinastri MD-312]|uniref:Unplaced genomic scaffold scaffold_50, whole genome shotgun sequence n=1 Tax=Hydnomerulius pinastri MD-312 TaxID=994086 RepID=A0A0C9W154_9AGAM|nr:hypothetical protein HYDPIDRAFT_118369 [Hydnomerulius pinastri MD-312]